jgi:hypothetical protein
VALLFGNNQIPWLDKLAGLTGCLSPKGYWQPNSNAADRIPSTLLNVNSNKSCEVEPLKYAEYKSGVEGFRPACQSLRAWDETSLGSLPPIVSVMQTTDAWK